MMVLKETVHPKIFFCHFFTRPRVVPNMYKFLRSDKHRDIFFENAYNLGGLDSIV